MGSDESPATAPDSLVPVRFVDLIEEKTEGVSPAPNRSRRNAVRVISAFVAGAALVLSIQAVLTRTGSVPNRQVHPEVRPVVATARAVSVPEPVVNVTPSEPVPVPSIVTNDIAQSGTPTERVQPATAAEPAPTASSDVSEDSPPKPTIRRKRKRPSSASGYEPPTAQFPDYGK
jgi:hypothetical protein